MKTLLCEETKDLMITQLIGLGEAQRRIYEQFEEQEPECNHKRFKHAYELHCEELETLIKYQRERI